MNRNNKQIKITISKPPSKLGLSYEVTKEGKVIPLNKKANLIEKCKCYLDWKFKELIMNINSWINK